MCKFCQSEWFDYNVLIPPDLYNVYLVEDHEGNQAPALWEEGSFKSDFIPFGYVRRWARISHWIATEDGIIGFIAIQKFHFYEDMFEEDPVFERQS